MEKTTKILQVVAYCLLIVAVGVVIYETVDRIRDRKLDRKRQDESDRRWQDHLDRMEQLEQERELEERPTASNLVPLTPAAAPISSTADHLTVADSPAPAKPAKPGKPDALKTEKKKN